MGVSHLTDTVPPALSRPLYRRGKAAGDQIVQDVMPRSLDGSSFAYKAMEPTGVYWCTTAALINFIHQAVDNYNETNTGK